jgi:hypothetical protein
LYALRGGKNKTKRNVFYPVVSHRDIVLARVASRLSSRSSIFTARLLANVWHAPNLVIVRILLTPSERREFLRAVAVLGGDRYTNHIGHFLFNRFPLDRLRLRPSSVVRAMRLRVSAESNDLNSTRVGFSSSFRPPHAQPTSIDRSRERVFSNLCKNFLNTFPQRASHASVPSSRRRARGYECRLSMRSRRGKRSSRNERISKVESLSNFRSYEPSMDLKISQRQLEM